MKNNYFKYLFDSMSNHIANKINRLALINENIEAKAFIEGINPVSYQTKHNLIESKMNSV